MKWWFVMDLKHNMLGRVWNKWGNVATFPNEFGCRCCRYTTLYILLPSWFVRLLVQLQFSCPCVLCILYTHFGSSTHNKHTPQCERPRTRTWARQRRSEWTAQQSTHILTAYSAQSPNQIYRYSIFIHESGREKYNNKKHTHNTSYFMYIHTYFYFERIIHFIHSFVTWFSFPFTSSSSSLVSVCVCVHIFLHIFSVSFALLVSFYASPFDAGELIYH